MTRKDRKRLSRREFLNYSAAAAAAAALAACQPGTPSTGDDATSPPPTEASTGDTTAPTAAPAVAGGTISVWGWPTQLTRSRDAEGNELITERVKEDTGLDLELNLVDQPDLGPKLKAALPAGTGPDVVTTDFDVMGPYWQFMTPLNAFGEAEWGASWQTDVFTDTALSEMATVANIVNQPGEAMYLPGNMQLLGWPYYFLQVFEENGIDASALNTWDDFEAACNTLKAAGIIPIIGAEHPACLVDWYQSLVEVSAPGKSEQVQRGTGKFTDPDMLEAFNLIAKVYNEFMQEGAIAAETGGAFDLFHGGGGAMCMTFSGTPYFGFLNADSETVRENMNNNYGTFLLPGSKGLAATDAGVAIVNDSENKENAWEYVKWATVGKGAEYDATDAGQPFGAKAIAPAPRGTDFDTNLGAPLYDALQNGDNKFRRILCADVYNALTTVIPGVVTGQIQAEQAAAEVQEAFDRNCGHWVS